MEDAKTIMLEFLKNEQIVEEDFDLLQVADGITVARARLKIRLRTLEECATNLHEVICCPRPELVSMMTGLTSPTDLRSQIEMYLKDANYLIGIIRRSTEYLRGRVSHKELQQAEEEDLNKMDYKYFLLKNDLLLFLDFADHQYNNVDTTEELSFLLAE